jgi:serine/threonine-protein kinase HipA
VGAQLYPEHAEVAPVKQVNAVPASDEEIEQLLQGYRKAPLAMGPDSDDFRISLAGAQEKTALLWFDNQWCRPEGSTPTSHIIKLPIGHIAYNNLALRESSENEWLCLRIAEQFGLPVAQTQLARFGEQRVLIVERFDLRWSRDSSWLIRFPQEDFCQALGVPPALKYEADGGPGIAAAMELLLGSQQPLLDRDTFFKSQIVFWILAAIDGHAKNFSLFIEPETTYRMTPLYDVLSGYPFMHARGMAPQKAKMAMAALGKGRHYRWSQILPRHFISTARAVGYSEEKTLQVMAELKAQTKQAIVNVGAMLPDDFRRSVSDAIFAGVRRQAESLPG